MINLEATLSLDSTTRETSWWIWTAWVEKENGCGFVYGCAARSFRAPEWRDQRTVQISAGQLIICQSLVTEDAFKAFKDTLNAGKISFGSMLCQEVPPLAVKARRSVIQDCLGQTAVQATLFYSLPDVAHLLGDIELTLEHVLSILQDELNLPFKDSYATRLGNFEIFDLHAWLDESRPFLIEGKRDSSKDRRGPPQTMEICRAPEFASDPHMAHFVGWVNNDVIVDRLTKLPTGALRVQLPIPEMLDQYEFRLFDADGETILHYERNSFINRISLNVAPVGRQMNIDDDLSERAKQKDQTLTAQASVVSSTSHHRSLIGGPENGSWRKFAEDMADLVSARLPQSGEDKWFARGIEGEVGGIAHLNNLLNGGYIHSAVLADPWFGAEAVKRFAIRLSSQDVHLTIITSWATIDPDTNEQLALESDPTSKLAVTLSHVQPFLNPKLMVINLLDGKKQAFHDRYLLLYPHEGVPKVFLLSNSLNKMAGNWPFTMSLLAPDVGREVQLYLEGLREGRDTTRNRSLNITFRWPSHGG